MLRSKLTSTCMVLGMMALMLALALSMFEYVTTDPLIYSEIQHELDVFADVGVTEDELKLVQRDVASYLKGEEVALPSREVSMYGIQKPVFNQREIDHMKDVSALFTLERQIRSAAWQCALLLLVLSVLLNTPRSVPKWLRKNARATLVALGIWVLGAGAIVLVFGLNFDAAFTKFHQVLFTNDLWLLDPRTDAMIRMYPEAFFVRMAMNIGIGMAIGVALAVLPMMTGFLPERLLTIQHDKQ